jgi:hypothetical protein
MAEDEPAGHLAFDAGRRPLVRGSREGAAWRITLGSALDRGVRDLDLLDSPTPAAVVDAAREVAGWRWGELRVFVRERSDPFERAGGSPPRDVVRLRGLHEDTGASAETSIGGRVASVDDAVPPGTELRLGEWVALPAHLLRGSAAIAASGGWRRRGARLLARNVFADGRLHGGFSAAPATGPPQGPQRLSELASVWSPVLNLGFLTEGRRRTLPEAAIAFAWAEGALPSVPFRDPQDVERWVRTPPIRALDGTELARVRALPDSDESPSEVQVGAPSYPFR